MQRGRPGGAGCGDARGPGALQSGRQHLPGDAASLDGRVWCPPFGFDGWGSIWSVAGQTQGTAAFVANGRPGMTRPGTV